MRFEDTNQEDLPSYRVEITDLAKADARSAYENRLDFVEPETAREWFRGLYREMEKLSYMPRGYIEVKDTGYAGEIHRMPYGKGRNAYRVLYRVIDPAYDDVGIVRVLRVRHAMQNSSDD